MALLGAASAFVESTLSQVYKSKVGNEYRGGTPYFIEKGLNMKWFAIIVAVVVTLSYGVLLPGIQSSSIAVGFENSNGISKYITGILLVILLAAIIFGGVKNCRRFTNARSIYGNWICNCYMYRINCECNGNSKYVRFNFL